MSNLKKKKSFNHGASRDQSPQMRSKERKSAGAGLLGNIFGSIFPKPSSQENEAERSIEVSQPSDVIKRTEFKVNENGELDLESVPEEFKEIVKQLYDKISQPKEMEVEKRNKGPSVDKGLKEEEILLAMRTETNAGNPWDTYTKVRPALRLLCHSVISCLLQYPVCLSYCSVKNMSGVLLIYNSLSIMNMTHSSHSVAKFRILDVMSEIHCKLHICLSKFV